MTIREIVSEVMNDLRDSPGGYRVSRRYLYSKLAGYSRTYINQETTTKLFKQLELFTPIKCVEMHTVPLSECCQVPRGLVATAQKSVCKLPDLYLTTQKRPLIYVYNPTQELSFEPITPKEYQNLLKMPYGEQASGYFWLDEGYLIIPNVETELVRVDGLFLDSSQASHCDACCDGATEVCPSVLDSTFICPDYLLSVVKDKTLESLMRIHEPLAQKEQRPK